MAVYQGDCLDVLRMMPKDSIDALVTDPPAGISFMGKGWDGDKGGRKEWCAWMESVMRECLRVMKPGAHGLVWALPRTSHWTATALEDAGFEIRDCVYHLFGSGFPKSLDVSKAIDKAAGAERTEKVWVDAYHDGGSRSESESQGYKAGINTTMGNGNTRSLPATDAAKQWAGFGTALKPAVENWILVRKPCSEKTVAANVLKWGTGAMNIDASRIEAADQAKLAKNWDRETQTDLRGGNFTHGKAAGIQNTASAPSGRFPSNLVLSHSPHCTDDQCDIECAIAMLDAQSGSKCGAAAPVRKKPTPQSTNIANYKPHTSVGDDGASFRGDTGGASRFFYCAKVSSSERNAGLEGMDKKRYGTFDCTDSGGNKLGRSGKEPTAPQANNHPTVKPQKLMRYLIRMVTPPNGTVLDPFMGSGSTGLAAKSEGFGFIGIEREQEYFEIAKARIDGPAQKSI